jgi:hypothetical protein
VGLIAVGMEFIERDEFDPESLPPPAAGTTVHIPANVNTDSGSS